MQIIDFYPTQGFYKPGAPVKLKLKLKAANSKSFRFEADVFQIEDKIDSWNQEVDCSIGLNSISMKWHPPETPGCGYGIQLSIFDKSTDTLLGSVETAFDVQTDWTDFPRYGYISDFGSQRISAAETIEALLAFHITGLQFYDWQYRHDTLLPKEETYIDPLGRSLSLSTVNDLITAAHSAGMAAMPYLAIYGASIEFWREHADWGMYAEDGTPHTFEDFLGLMDPSKGGLWANHLLNECRKITDAMNFDGYHVDQYGEPKQAWTKTREEIDLPEAFNDFIGDLKDQGDDRPVIFNAVGNWPIDSLVNSRQDFMYIEVWPPTPTYNDLRKIVGTARKNSGSRPVMIAQYLHNNQEANIRLSNAVIMASGGSRIEIGENARLLADPYFPKHEEIGPELYTAIRKSADFFVRYGELIGPGAQDWSPEISAAPASVSAFGKKINQRKIVHLVNFTGIDDPKWTETHSAPDLLSNFQLEIKLRDTVSKVYSISPDSPSLEARQCNFQQIEEILTINVPSLEYLTTLIIIINGVTG